MRRDQALWDEGGAALPTARDPRPSSSTEGRRTGQPWTPRVYDTFRKVFNAKPFTLEQEKRIKGLFDRAPSEDAAFEAIDLMYQEGVVYPTGRDVREAIERVGLKYALHEWAEPGSGPWISFRDWYAVQDDEMKARVLRVFPSLKPEEWTP